MLDRAVCYDPGTLAAYQDGALATTFREAVEGDAESCLRCQGLLFLLGAATDETLPAPSVEGPWDALLALAPRRAPTVRRWTWGVAAALLLLALAVGRMARGPGDRSTAPETTGSMAGEASSGFPEGILGAGPGASRDYLARGTSLLLGEDARVRVSGKGRSLRAEAGTFWLEASGPREIQVALPDTRLTLKEASLAVSILPLAKEAGSWLVREALAGEGTYATVWVLEGQIDLDQGDRRRHAVAGTKLVEKPGGTGWVQANLSEKERTDLEESRLRAATAAGSALLPPGLRLAGTGNTACAQGGIPPSYRWVTVLVDRGPTTELGLTLGAAGRWYRWVPSLAGHSPKPQEVVEIVWDGETLTGRVNGRRELTVDRSGLDRILSVVSRPAWELAVWGGSVTVARSTLSTP